MCMAIFTGICLSYATWWARVDNLPNVNAQFKFVIGSGTALEQLNQKFLISYINPSEYDMKKLEKLFR